MRKLTIVLVVAFTLASLLAKQKGVELPHPHTFGFSSGG